jgi:NADH:ubiquinone oxidoreductase subunit E
VMMDDEVYGRMSADKVAALVAEVTA